MSKSDEILIMYRFFFQHNFIFLKDISEVRSFTSEVIISTHIYILDEFKIAMAVFFYPWFRVEPCLHKLSYITSKLHS